MKLVGLQSFIRWIFFQIWAAFGCSWAPGGGPGRRPGGLGAPLGGGGGVLGRPEGVRDRLGAILEPCCGNARQRVHMCMCVRVCV